MCVLVNQLAFPGLGTIMAGQRIGYAQAALMLVGFTLLTGFMLWYIVAGIRAVLSDAGNAADWHAQYRPYLWAGKYGLVLSIVAWGWSLFSSIRILRRPPPIP